MRRRSQMSSGAGVREPIDFAGVGAVTAYGWGRDRLISGLMSGVSAVLPHDGFDESIGGKAFGAGVAEGGLESDGPSRFARALRAAAREAVEGALERGWTPGPTVGLVHSVVLGEVDLL